MNMRSWMKLGARVSLWLSLTMTMVVTMRHAECYVHSVPSFAYLEKQRWLPEKMYDIDVGTKEMYSCQECWYDMSIQNCHGVSIWF